jgi:redox-sensitive bicupin YhaK (pirin superfamily)
MTRDLVLEPREVPLGGIRGLTVHRTLPHRALPTVGAWCFVDHFGPTREAMTVLPHPHTGLQTVTWPLTGNVRHRDSLGSDVVLKPGELNLMTSGDGVSHSEFSVDDVMIHGVQLWVALPDEIRIGAPAFEHLPDLPRTGGNGWRAIVLVGEIADARSTATVYSPLVAAELTVSSGGIATVPLRPEFEHAVLAVDGPAQVAGSGIEHRQMRYIEPGHSSLDLEVWRDTTLLLIGGEPFTEPLVMWWNFIGRTHEDIEKARADWEQGAERFGHVEGHDGQLVPAPPLPHVRLTPRHRR